MITATEARILMLDDAAKEERYLKSAESLIRHCASNGYVNCFMDWKEATSDTVKRNVIQTLKDNGYTVKEFTPIGNNPYGGIVILWCRKKEE